MKGSSARVRASWPKPRIMSRIALCATAVRGLGGRHSAPDSAPMAWAATDFGRVINLAHQHGLRLSARDRPGGSSRRAEGHWHRASCQWRRRAGPPGGGAACGGPLKPVEIRLSPTRRSMREAAGTGGQVPLAANRRPLRIRLGPTGGARRGSGVTVGFPVLLTR